MAVALGLVLGAVLIVVSRASVRFMTPEDPAMGFARVAAATLLRLVAVVSLLTAFHFLARPGLAYFGVALIVAFLTGAVLELFWSGRPSAQSIARRG